MRRDLLVSHLHHINSKLKSLYFTMKESHFIKYETTSWHTKKNIVDTEIIAEQIAINSQQTRHIHYSPNHKMTSYEACFPPQCQVYIPTYFRLNRLLFSNYSVHKKVRTDANASSSAGSLLQLKKPCIHIFLQNMCCIWS